MPLTPTAAAWKVVAAARPTSVRVALTEPLGAVMARLHARFGVTNCTATCMSFLDVDPADERYADVTHAVVDPSCSGSGIPDRWDAGGAVANDARLARLADLQVG